MVHTREHWPQVISPSAKNKICDNFLKMTSYTTLKPAVCASCGESFLESSLQLVSVSTINVDLLRCPDAGLADDPVVEPWLDVDAYKFVRC